MKNNIIDEILLDDITEFALDSLHFVQEISGMNSKVKYPTWVRASLSSGNLKLEMFTDENKPEGVKECLIHIDNID